MAFAPVSTETLPNGGVVDFAPGTRYVRVRARYPSGKGEVCKTFMRRFDSDPRLQPLTLIFARVSRASLGLTAVTNHAVMRLRSCAASLEPQFQVQSPLRGPRFR